MALREELLIKERWRRNISFVYSITVLNLFLLFQLYKAFLPNRRSSWAEMAFYCCTHKKMLQYIKRSNISWRNTYPSVMSLTCALSTATPTSCCQVVIQIWYICPCHHTNSSLAFSQCQIILEPVSKIGIHLMLCLVTTASTLFQVTRILVSVIPPMICHWIQAPAFAPDCIFSITPGFVCFSQLHGTQPLFCLWTLILWTVLQ